MLYILIIFAICYIGIRFSAIGHVKVSEILLLLLPFVVFAYQTMKSRHEKKLLLCEYEKEKNFITEITEALRKTLELDELLKTILSTLSKRLGHRSIFIYLIDKNNNKEYLKCIGFPGAINIRGISALNIPTDSKLTNIVTTQKESRIVDLSLPEYTSERKTLNIDKIGVVPMHIRKETIGVIIFKVSSENVDFSDIEIFAVHSAMAIDNAKLFEQVKESAITDGLTKLYNKRYLDQALSSGIDLAKRYKSSLSVLMIDIDDFKHYNDTNGHIAGDNCLYTVAQIISRNIWKTDIVTRYGGEEFVVILHGTNKEGAILAAEKIRKAIKNCKFPYGENQPLGKLTVSIGVSTFPEDAPDSTGLISAADKALYTAKKTGKNKVCTFSV